MTTAEFKAFVLPYLGDLLDYRRDGALIWRKRAAHWFASANAAAAWNARYPGTLALNKIGNHGYRCGTICGVGFLAHRVVWAIHHGYWPDECDHIDGVRHHNRIENLRDTDKSGNQRNARLRSDNTSGRVGVYQRSDSGRWGAYIGSTGDLVHLGTFDTRAEAVAARRKAERSLGYSARHGSQAHIINRTDGDRLDQGRLSI